MFGLADLHKKKIFKFDPDKLIQNIEQMSNKNQVNFKLQTVREANK